MGHDTHIFYLIVFHLAVKRTAHVIVVAYSFPKRPLTHELYFLLISLVPDELTLMIMTEVETDTTEV